MPEKIIQEQKYFSNEELLRLKELESQQVQKVFYHHWENKAKPLELIEILDYIEFVCIDNSRFVFAASELLDAIEVPEINFDKKALELAEKFDGKISIRKEDVSTNQPWQRIIEYPIDEVLLDCDINKQYFSDRVLLKMGPVKLLMEISEFGLKVKELTDHLN